MFQKSLNRRSVVLVALFIIAAYALGVTGARLLDLVRALGHNIPQKELAQDYLFAVIWAGILGLTILAWPVPRGDKRGLLWIWLAKCFVTLGFMLFYENRYGLDAYMYFDQSVQAGALDWNLVASSVGRGSQLIINLCALQNLLLPDSFHALKVSFAMVGLVAIYLFYRAALLFLQREDLRVLYILGFFPSILFWSSTLGKDPIVLFGISVYTYGVVAWWRLRRVRYMVVIATGILVTMAVRLWLGPILLAPLAVFALWGVKGLVRKCVVLALVLTSFWVAVQKVRENFRIETTQDVVNASHQISRSWQRGGSATQVSDFSSLAQMIKLAPIEAFTALFRPLPGEVMNLFGWLAGLENAVLLLALFVAAVRTRWWELKDPLVMWVVVLIAAWAHVYGFISSQNLGSAVRFKLQVLPLLWGMLLYLSRRRSEVPRPVVARVLGQEG
jgi:hypothetical protein